MRPVTFDEPIRQSRCEILRGAIGLVSGDIYGPIECRPELVWLYDLRLRRVHYLGIDPASIFGREYAG